MAFFQGATDVKGYLGLEAIGSIDGDAAKPAKLWYLKMENTIEFSSEAKREQYRAEVRTLRAMQYFWKVMCYGDFPFTEEVFASIEESMVPRTLKEEILAFIKKELSESINALPKTAVAGRLTRGAAQAFLARVYLKRYIRFPPKVVFLWGKEQVLMEKRTSPYGLKNLFLRQFIRYSEHDVVVFQRSGDAARQGRIPDGGP